jgi:hypothetical protein
MVLNATGHAHARFGTLGIESDALRYDLMRNTILASGNVQIITQDGVFTGAAYSGNLTTNTGMLLKLIPSPATYTVRDDDFAEAVEEPALPETFQAVDLGEELPYIASTRADIVPNASVRLTPARFPVNAKITIPSPSYLYVFAPNPALGVTPPTLPATSFDQPYGLIATPNSLLAAHLRYSTSNGIRTGIDEHLVDGLQRYLVASFEPNDSHIDIDAFEQISPHLTHNVIGSLANDEKTARYVMQHTSKYFTTTLTLSQFASNLAVAGANYANDEIQVSTVTRPIGNLGSYKLRTGFGYDNVSGQLPYNADFRTTLGGSIYTRTVQGPFKTSLSGQYDFSSTQYDYPHQSATSTALLTLSRRVSPAISFYSNVSFTQIYNRYGSQAFPSKDIDYYLGLYPDPTQPIIAPDGTPYPGYAAYSGLQTIRTYFLSTTLAPNPNFNLLLSLTATRSFPQFHGIGSTPLTAAFNLRVRPLRNIAVSFGRSYVFGWDLQHLTPQYTLGISP